MAAPTERKPRLVVVGSSNTDFVVRSERIPAPGETVLGSAFLRASGGKGANQAVAAARLGAEVTLVARVGSDDLGRAAIEAYQAEGIDTSYVAVDPQAPSGVALVVVDDRGENAIAVAPGANANLSVGEVAQARAVIETADVLLIQLETPLDASIRAIEIARDSGTLVILNPAPARALPSHVLARVDVLTPNESEVALLAESLGGDGSTSNDTSDHAASLLGAGAQIVLVTRGASGVLLAQADRADQSLPALAVTAVDSTGAGDAFNGALAVELGRSADFVTAIGFAQRAAAWSVGRPGAQPSFPTLADLG